MFQRFRQNPPDLVSVWPQNFFFPRKGLTVLQTFITDPRHYYGNYSESPLRQENPDEKKNPNNRADEISRV
jgi:hypothetical protein